MGQIVQQSNSQLLRSWKEIALYVGVGVRTVQRYEHQLGLPVRRPANRPTSPVIAFIDEMDAWLRKARKSPEEDGICDQQRVCPLCSGRGIVAKAPITRAA